MRLLTLTVFIAIMLPAGAEPVTFYVSPTGRDTWSGVRPTATAGKTDGPFATIVRARDAVRQAKRAGRQGPFVVELRGGMYALEKPLTFAPEDSGTAAAPVVYRAYRNEKPLISGGRVIRGFKDDTLNGVRCWSVKLPEVARGWRFGQLFVKHRGEAWFQRRYRPTKGMLVVAGLTYSPARKSMAHRAAQQDFRFFPGDLQPWQNLSDVEVVALHSWSASRLYIERLDAKRRVVRFTSIPTFRIGHWYPHGRNPYYVENVKEELKKPGQWYLDRPRATLYYAPLPGETPENVTVVAPRQRNLLLLRGDAETRKFVEHLRFEGLSFCHAAWRPPRQGYDVSQGQPTLPAAVELTWARECAFQRCTISHTGAYAISLGLGCHADRVRGCRLFDLGGGGVKVGDSRMDRAAAPPVLPTNNVVENNLIADGGLINFSANGVWAGIVKGTVIRHNEIRGFPYSGIAVGWCWRYDRTSAADNRIEYNHIHHVMQLIQDGGGIYTLGQQPGTVIRGNVIHDCLKGPFACNVGQIGIYLDQASGPFRVEDNLVYNVQMGGFTVNSGRGNTVQNNIFAFIRQDPITCTVPEKQVSYTFRRNLVYLRQRNMISSRYDPGRANTVFDENLYWSMSGKPPRFAGRTFAQWQATGRDVHSVIADPRFVAPQRFDFRLDPSSPALKLGFKPFDPSRAGLEPKYRDLDQPPPSTVRPPVYSMKWPTLPPVRPDFSLDLEEVPVGRCPREFHVGGQTKGRADFVVTEGEAHSGKRFLRGYELGKLSQPFYPYLIHSLSPPVTSGKVTFSFAFRNSKKRPDVVSVECRDYANRAGGEFLNGPRVRFARDGAVTVVGKRLSRAPLGEWCVVRVEFVVGENSPGTFTVTITPPGDAAKSTTQPFPDPGFRALTWIGIISYAVEAAEFSLDDLQLKVE